ncbi:MAG TPA: gamma-glutamyltransferase [Candidatus Rokubacteria bacterium]|nr:MAG: gamma-glutamyltransferase [Candidatus Rokubacteria bacterium GWA2_73_35]HBH03872.1 gamma-glutamyltransferase [Candidatus Rokubacteria bacterium]
MPEVGYSHRQVALGRDGMVAAAHPLATLAGLDTLKAGGTAADAAVAVNAVLAVTQPNMCGVGGDLFCLYWEAATRRVHFLNGSGRSGSRAGLEELGRRGLARLPVIGPPTVSVPGCVRAWGMLLERFGTRPLAELLGPAIHYARDGFPLSSLVSQAIDEYVPVTPDPEWHRVFAPQGRAPAPGALFAQPDLGRTLAALAAEGPDLFYAGRVGQAIARRLEAEGFLTPEDLAAHAGEWGEPLATTYRGVTVHETPPPTQGLAALLTLNLLEGVPLATLPLHSPEHLHLLLEMTKLAYADRDRWIGDPAHARLPVAALLAKPYAARRRAQFDPDKAQAYAAGDPEGDTTGFVVADGHGNVASVIQSLFNSFGSGIVVPGAGVPLQNRGRHFSLEPGHPAVLAPRTRPFHTLIAAIATREDRPVLGFATMGGNGQAMFHAQVLTNVLDYGLHIQEAIERPRFLIGAFLPDDPADAVYVEERVPAATLAALQAKGHLVRPAPALFPKVGHAHGIVLRDGTLMGGADPRGDGVALGF